VDVRQGESGTAQFVQFGEKLRCAGTYAVRQLSKQAAGQLVHILVMRGYLKREVDSEDRRRLTIGLTERGRAAAKVLAAAGITVDDELMSRVETKDIERTRRVLFELVDIERKTMGAGCEITSEKSGISEWK
jgi:hypothetical protein